MSEQQQQKLRISGRRIERIDGKISVALINGELRYVEVPSTDPPPAPDIYAELCPDDGDWCLILRPEGQRSFLEYNLLPDGGIGIKVLPK